MLYENDINIPIKCVRFGPYSEISKFITAVVKTQLNDENKNLLTHWPLGNLNEILDMQFSEGFE